MLLFLRGRCGIDVGILQAEAVAEIVDSCGDKEDGIAAAGRGPALDVIQNRKVRAGNRAGAPHGNTEAFGSEFVVGGENPELRRRCPCGHSHGDVGAGRLGHDEVFEIVPLAGDDGIE